MKIQKVQIKDFKILKDVDLDLNGKNLLLIGDNGVGKSSFMQFIEIALGRTDKVPPKAEGEGMIIAQKEEGDYIFQVKFKDNKPVITVTAPDGNKDNRKSAIAGIVGAIDFDINKFVSLSDSKKGRKEQVEIFKSLLPEEVKEELEKYEQNILVNYDTRTDTNRKIKEIDGFLKSSSIYGHHRQIKEVDVTALSKEIEEQATKNTEIEEIKKRFEERQQQIDELIAKQAKAEAYLKINKVVDLTEKREQLNKASDTNKLFAEAQELISKETHLAELKEESGELTALIDSSKQAIEDAIKDMDSPVEGLTFDEEGLIYHGVPVSTASLSTSEIIELGVMLKMAQNPEFGVLMIEHGESIGTERLNMIQDLAKSNGWQIIMEQVQRGAEKLTYEFITE